jgi:hypothetical protein
MNHTIGPPETPNDKGDVHAFRLKAAFFAVTFLLAPQLEPNGLWDLFTEVLRFTGASGTPSTNSDVKRTLELVRLPLEDDRAVAALHRGFVRLCDAQLTRQDTVRVGPRHLKGAFMVVFYFLAPRLDGRGLWALFDEVFRLTDLAGTPAAAFDWLGRAFQLVTLPVEDDDAVAVLGRDLLRRRGAERDARKPAPSKEEE